MHLTSSCFGHAFAGLFRRAIIEDGSALTPMLASSRQPGAQQAAVQHLRIVAALSECPVPPARHLQPASGQSGSGADEGRLNAAMFECLRSKPAELIVRRVPLELLHLSSSPTSGQPLLQIQARWLRLLEVHTNTSLALDEPDNLVPVDARQVDLLVQRALDDGPTGELFNALFPSGRPSSLGSRPLFGPLLDSSVVPDEELAHAMLRSSSHFGTFDLLIGVSGSPLSASTTGDEEPFGLEQPIGAQIGQRLANSGLSNEQAVELVGNFARSHYRYHTQEIANSIMSQYLSSSSVAAVKSRPEFMLDSLLAAFQDSLVNVASLRVAIIHALRQLEPTLELYLAREQPHPVGSSFVAFARAKVGQGRATYLFQLGPSEPVAIESEPIGNISAGEHPSRLDEQPRRPLTFTCAFERLQETSDAHGQACERLSWHLASFSATGRLGAIATAADDGCNSASQRADDTHSVKLATAGRCQGAQSSWPPSAWPLFDPFTWQAVQPASTSQASIELSASFLSRASFWSNFIPALNCSRTQPIVPSSLAPASGQHGSSALLNLNLLFNCNQQHQSASQVGRRAQEVLELLEAQAHERHRAAQAAIKAPAKSAQSNHHSLRMANMSQSAGSIDELAQDERDQPSGSKGAGAPPKLANSVKRATDTNQARYAGLALLLCSILLVASLSAIGCHRCKTSGPTERSAEMQPQASLPQAGADQLEPAEQLESAGFRAGQPGVDECMTIGKHVNTLEQQDDEPSTGDTHDAASLMRSWPLPEHQYDPSHLCRSHSQTLLVDEHPGQPIMVPILSNSIGRASAGSNRRRRVKISEPMVQPAPSTSQPSQQLFCPVHQPQSFYLNAPQLWAHQLEQAELQAYQREQQQLANYANQLHQFGANQ